MLWAFNGNKSLSLGPDDVRPGFSVARALTALCQVILDKMHSIAEMCCNPKCFITEKAAFDSIRRGPSFGSQRACS
jgi:hypothetical protein